MALKRKFRREWLLNDEFRSWLRPVEDDPNMAFCRTCHKEFHSNLTTIRRHQGSQFHQTTMELKYPKEQRKDIPETAPSQRVNPDNEVQKAMILMICFLAEHNLPFLLADHMVDLWKVMLPDSCIAKGLYMKKTKTTEITKAIASCLTAELAEKLRQNKFSIIIDESADTSTRKCLSLIIKYFDQEAIVIKTSTLNLLDIYDDKDGSSRENLYKLVISALSAHSIPLENLIGFAADGDSNITGVHNSLSSRLKETLPGITIFKCICQSIHLSASEAVKSLHCEGLIQNIFRHFSHSAKRKQNFKKAQEIKPHKILHYCQTQWPSLHQAVQCLLEQWEPLKLYFSEIKGNERLRLIELINNGLKDPSIFLFFNFLHFILPAFTNNLMFERDGPTIHLVYDKVIRFYRNLLHYFCKRECLAKVDLMAFDPTISSNHLPLNQIYLGASIHRLLQMEQYNNNKDMVEYVRSQCRDVMILMCQQIKERFDFNNKLWYFASFLAPKKLLDSQSRDSLPTISDFVKTVPRIYKDNIQDLDNEWRDLDTVHIPQHIKEEVNIIKFYNELGKLDDNDGNIFFKKLSVFSLQVLALPSTNAAAEQFFSKINVKKLDASNKVQIPALQARTIISEAVKEFGSCYDFTPSQKMLDIVS